MVKSVSIKGLQFKKDREIKEEKYDSKEEFKFNRNTDVIPKKKNRLVCVFFSEDRGCSFLFRDINSKDDCFRHRKGLYIIDNESIHLTRNGTRVSFYLEGISTPIKMSNIERVTEKVKYTDLFGNVKETIVQKIKGLKFDAKILDTFANRKFAELFTKQPMKGFEVYILLIGIISLVMIGISYGLIYYFR